MASPVEGPSGNGQDAVRPPVAIAGVDSNGKIRHLLLTSTGALSLATSSVNIGEVQLLGADGLHLGAVDSAGSLQVNDVGLPDTLGQKNMAGSTSVALASDQASIPVAATLGIETTKTIGVTRSADGSGNLLTSTTNALDINIKSGNPTSIQANAIYNATQPSPADTGQLQLQVGARGSLRAELFNAGGTIGVAAGVSNTDGQGNSNALVTLARGQYWNPTGPSWDLARGNFNTTTGDTGAKLANFLGATQTNYNARGAVITILIGTVTGTSPTLQASLQYSYDGGTTWTPLVALGASITPASGNTVVWNIYPGIGTLTPAASGGVAVATQYNYASMTLPRTWRIALTIGGTNPSITITSVNVNYIV